MKTFAQKHLVKIVFFLVLISVTAAFFLNYIYRQEVRRGRADDELQQLTFIPNTVRAQTGQEFVTTIRLDPTRSFLALDYIFSLSYDPSKLQVRDVTYRLGRGPEPIGTPAAMAEEVPQPGVLTLRDSLGEGYPIVAGSNIDVVTITFTSRSNDQSMVTLDTTKPHYFTARVGPVDEQIEVISTTLIVNGTLPTPTCSPDDEQTCFNITPTPTPTCDPRKAGGCGLVGSPTPIRGNTVLNMKVKLQGITTQPRVTNPLSFKITVKGGVLTSEVIQQVAFTPNADGTWSGQMGFDLPLDSLDLGVPKYSVYLKGPKHLQKRVCHIKPTESAGGTYRCARDGIELLRGQYPLDMSGILLLAGDLPVTNNQQNGVIDSQDTSYIRQNFGKTDAEVLTKADLNLDGNIDSQDFSLVIAALSIKYDDPVEGQ